MAVQLWIYKIIIFLKWMNGMVSKLYFGKVIFNGLYYSALKRKEFLTYAIWTKFSGMENFQMLKLDLEKAEEPEIKLPTSVEKAMAPHSSTLAWKIPWTEEPGRLQSMRSLRVGNDWSDFTLTFHFHALEKETATHFSILAWRVPGTEEPSGLPSMGLHRVGHDWSDLAAAAVGSLRKQESSRWKIPRTEEPGRLQSMGSRRVRYDWATSPSPLFYWLHQSLWLCGSQQTVENSERDGNTRASDLPPKKSVCRSRSNS